MCERRRIWRYPAIGAAVILAASTAAAQNLARLDSLTRLYQRIGQTALREQERADSAHNGRLGESVRQGPFVIFTLPELAGQAKEELRIADSITVADWLPALSPDSLLLRMRIDSSTTKPDIVFDELAASGRVLASRALTFDASLKDLARAVGFRLAVQYHDRQRLLLPVALSRWIEHDVAPAPVSASSWQRLVIDLSLSPAAPARACIVRDVIACRAALGFAAPTDSLTEWLDAPRRRDLVRSDLHGSGGDIEPDVVARRCVDQGDDQTCQRWLREHHILIGSAPPEIRTVFFRFAAELNPDPMRRRAALLTPGLDAEASIALMAGLPAPELLARFRDRLVASRPREVAPTAFSLWATMAWVLAFGAFALRSERWR
jgi:hypothetical protein